MTFFSHVEDSAEPGGAPRPPAHPPWRFEPDDVLPVSTPIDMVIGRGHDTVVGLYGVQVYPSGIALRLGAWWRSANKNQIFGEFLCIPPDRPGMRLESHGVMRWGLEFSDGRKVTNADPYPYSDPPEGRFDADLYAREEQAGPPEVPILTAGHGRSTPGRGHGYQNYWLWPLPPPGPLTIACQWTTRGIEETATEIDAAAIIEAAERTQPLWP